MIRLRKINKILKNITMFLFLILILGLSYAFFEVSIIGSESSATITGAGGTMDITFDGGSNITMSKIYPKEVAWGTKTFTVMGNNTTNLTMNYYLNLVIKTNTFSYGSLKYKLTSTNTGSNGSVVPSTITMQEIGSGARSILLGNGSFSGPTNGNKVHSYTLNIYFPDTGEDQDYDNGKSINSYIEILEGKGTSNEYLTDVLINNYSGASLITEAPSGTFDNVNGNTENVMYKMEDDYGMSYYLRGAKNYVNNNIIFAEHQWKILRINGDGSIRLIYNGTCPNNSCIINYSGTATQIGSSAFNTNSNDNKYMGYMYGGANGVASTSREQATTNETSSTIKIATDTWYSTNLLGTDYENYLSDTLFCNDRQLQSELGGAATGTGFGTSDTTYATWYRLVTNKTPTLKCELKNDRFTVSDTTMGNGSLSYPIGLLTPDEAAISGLKYNQANSTYRPYLDSGLSFYTMGPGVLDYDVTDGDASIWISDSYGKMLAGYYGLTVNYSGGVRPVINLKPDTKILGLGIASNPYIVQEEYEPSLKDIILAEYGGKENITEAPEGTFANINGSTDNLMYKTEDDYGMSYYLRGAKDYINNNLIFAEHQWKIVRINGDGSTRIIYNGTCPNNSCTINSTGTSTQIGEYYWNSTYLDDAKYLGYMYGGANGIASTQRDGSVSAAATYNETSNNAKVTVDNWYSTNILSTDYKAYISDTLFCNDRQLGTEIGGAYGGLGYGSNDTFYVAYITSTSHIPTLKCGLQNDRFTVDDTIIGNGALTYPVGLITSHETYMAGLHEYYDNSTNYLYTNQSYWTSTPFNFSPCDNVNVYNVNNNGSLWLDRSSYLILHGIRPVLNLKSTITVTGTGTTTDPYVVE
ncbi:MAG: hypothetical protein PHS24_03045 [Bacilli bacterium]|nr:hypothetical protein [Bacilli bacterium]